MQCRSVEKLKNLLLVTQSHAFQEDEKSRQEPEKENIQPAQHQSIQLNDSTKWENQSVVSLQPCALPKHQSTPVKRPMPHERPSKMVSPRLRKVGFKSKELNGNEFCNNENGEDDDDVNKLGRDTKSLGTAIDGVVDITNDGSDDDTDVDEDLDEEVVREALQPVSAATKTKNAVQESTKALELAFQHFTQLQSLFTQMSVQMKEKKDRKEIDDDTNGPEDEVEEDADSDLVPIVVWLIDWLIDWLIGS